MMSLFPYNFQWMIKKYLWEHRKELNFTTLNLQNLSKLLMDENSIYYVQLSQEIINSLFQETYLVKFKFGIQILIKTVF
jgi:hypothetical protein